VCPSAIRQRGLPFTVDLVYMSILKLRSVERKMIHNGVRTASLLVLSSPIQLLADLVDFESLSGRADELTGISRTDLIYLEQNKSPLFRAPI
jgi:hypothetical protein